MVGEPFGFLVMDVDDLPHVDDRMAECIHNCYKAAAATEHCADQCAEEGKEMARCLRLCRDVSDLAILHARLMVRNSEYSERLAEICADACEECADECGMYDAEHCEIAEEALRECAESCRDMAS